jgi:hypothetical protein
LYFQSSDSNNPGVYRTTEFPNQLVRLTDLSFTANVFQPMFLVDSCLVVRGNNGSTGDELYSVCNQNTNPLLIDSPAQNTFKVYPNPCTDHAIIRFETKTSAIQKLTLQGMDGKICPISMRQLDENSLQINGLDQLPSGLYYLSIQTEDNQQYQLKLAVQ